MLRFQEQKGLYKVDHLNAYRVRKYYQYLKKRPNKRSGQRLNNNTLNKHIQALHKFNDYLLQTGKICIPLPYFPSEEKAISQVKVLSIPEIKSLYEASYLIIENYKSYIIGARDRALLSVFYGCGLRRNEGYHLNVADINFEKKMLHVKKGKNYSERLIPFNDRNAEIFSEYINDARQSYFLCRA